MEISLDPGVLFLLVLVMASSYLAGLFRGRKTWLRDVPFDLAEMWQDQGAEPHTHRYDTMLGDGVGWRCGICGKPKAKGT